MGKIKKFIKLAFSGNAIIPWMMFVATIPMILLAFFVYNIAHQTLYKTVKNNLISSIEKKVEIINNYISERKLTLVQISKMPQLIDSIDLLTESDDKKTNVVNINTIKSLHKYFEHIASGAGIDSMYLVHANRKIVYTLKDEGVVGETLSGSKIILQELDDAFDGAKILWAPYLGLYDASTGLERAPTVLFSTPVLREGMLKGVLIIKLDLRAIEAAVSQLSDVGLFDETFLASLTNNQVNIMLHMRDEEKITTAEESPNPQILALLKRAIMGESGEPTELTLNNKTMLAIYRYIPHLNMGLLLEYNKDEIFYRIERLKRNMFLFIAFSLLLVGGIVFWVSRKLWQANRVSEQLLENILPTFVIEELKEKKQFAARNVTQVSILFVDLVDFTPFSSLEPPDVVVRTLTEIFSAFDQLTDKYQLEKIKTIGDGYMAIAGLMFTQEDHVNRAVDCALEMILAIKHFNLDHQLNFSLRAGVASGTITAGIIGRKKFSYDVWGNAVNKASRMESTGVANKVQITQESYDALQNKENYKITELKGNIVKGIGKIDTYLIEGHSR